MSSLDLVVLVPDANWEAAIRALLAHRHQSLGIRPVTFDVVRHPRRDPGVRTQAAALLRSLVGVASHALVLLDLSGSGSDGPAAQLESEIAGRLVPEWGDRSAVVVVDPELESWVWASSPHVARALRWRRRQHLHAYLEGKGHLEPGRPKPRAPKEAMEHILWITKTPRASAVYADIAEKVSLRNCLDPGFNRLCAVLQSWFPPDAT